MKKLLLLIPIFLTFNTLMSQVFWESKALTLPVGRRVRSISYVDANTVWVHLGYNGLLPDGTPEVQEWARSADGGNTWVSGSINIGNIFLGIGNIHAQSATVAYITAYDRKSGPNGGVWKTIDGGLTWTKQVTALYNSSSSFPNFVHFWDVNNGFTMGDPAGGYYEVYTTSNGGVNWSRVPSSNLPLPENADDYGIVDRFVVQGDTVWFSTTGGRLIKSVNKGLTWIALDTPVTTFNSETVGSAEFDFEDANNGIIVSSDFSFYNTTDGGLTWNVLPSLGTLRSANICHVPGATGTYITNGDDYDTDKPGSSYTIDGGLNWIDINPLGDIYAVLPDRCEFFNTSFGLNGGIGLDATTGGIFKYVGSFFLSNAQFSSDKLFTLSPNPTSGKMTLSGANINQVQVIDILGKVVFNNSYSSIAEVTVDLSNVNSGIYLVKVTNDLGNTSVLKAIKQ